MLDFRAPYGAVLVLAALALGGCAEERLAVQAVKQINRSPPPIVATGTGGIYKVGEPYEVAGIRYQPKEDPGYDQTGIASWYGRPFHGERTANGEVYDMYSMTAAHTTLPMPSWVRVTNLDNGRSTIVRVNDRGPFVAGRIIDVSMKTAEVLGFDQKGTARVRVQVVTSPSENMIAAKDAAPLRVGTAPAIVVPAVPTPVVATEKLAPVPGVTIAALPPPVAAAPRPAGNLPAAVQLVKVSPSSIFVQAGAFASYDNAAKLGQELAQLGAISISPVLSNGRQLYRVRIGPIPTVDRADATLGSVLARGHSEARIVVE